MPEWGSGVTGQDVDSSSAAGEAPSQVSLSGLLLRVNPEIYTDVNYTVQLLMFNCCLII